MKRPTYKWTLSGKQGTTSESSATMTYAAAFIPSNFPYTRQIQSLRAIGIAEGLFTLILAFFVLIFPSDDTFSLLILFQTLHLFLWILAVSGLAAASPGWATFTAMIYSFQAVADAISVVWRGVILTRCLQDLDPCTATFVTLSRDSIVIFLVIILFAISVLAAYSAYPIIALNEQRIYKQKLALYQIKIFQDATERSVLSSTVTTLPEATPASAVLTKREASQTKWKNMGSMPGSGVTNEKKKS